VGERHSGEGVARTEGLDAGRDSADLFVLRIQRVAASRVHLHHSRTHAADVLRAVWLDWRRVEEVEADGLLPSMAALACPSIR